MAMVSSSLTFPRISWWIHAIDSGKVIFDIAEHFQKMGYRNRYRISGSNNPVLLSVPLRKGREQRAPMGEVEIYNEERWQVQHWRTLVSVYKRTPYFDYYEPGLQPLFETKYDLLVDFNRDAFNWVVKQLKVTLEVAETNIYLREYPGPVKDVRNMKDETLALPKYYQVFEDRVGFIPDLSILDLLFSEGPRTLEMLKL